MIKLNMSLGLGGGLHEDIDLPKKIAIRNYVGCFNFSFSSEFEVSTSHFG